MLSCDPVSGTVTVPRHSGGTISTAVEDVCLSLLENSFAQSVQEATDELDENLCQLVNSVVLLDDEHTHTYSSSSPMIKFSSDNLTPGDKFSLYWPIADQFYSGSVSSVDSSGLCKISYDDGDVEILDMNEEIWRFTDSLIASATTAALPELFSNGKDHYNSTSLHLVANRFYFQSSRVTWVSHGKCLPCRRD